MEAADGMEVDDATKELRAKVKSLEKELKDLKALPESLHALLCQAQGGHTAAVEQLEQNLQAARAQARESRPIESRRASAEAYLKKTTRELEQVDSDLGSLKKQAAELQEQVAVQEEARRKKLVAHEAAKKQVANLAGALAEGPSPPPQPLAFVPEELACLTDILKLVDGNQLEEVCRTLTIDPKLIEGRTTALLSKVQAHIAHATPAQVMSHAASQSALAVERPVPADTGDLSIDEVLKNIPEECMDEEAKKKLRVKLEQGQLAKKQRSA